ncbi:hypothetical protein BGX30_008313 [Mortierella sp. GBA39]|nr:hypothetical protein BGX30_008313 [Mortierella sp. GBA39]
MHLIKLTLLASLASVAFSNCVLRAGDCPPGTHAENEPDICRDIGYPPNYHLLCVGGDPAPLAPVASRVGCVRSPDQCPSGTHAENEPEICRDMGYPPQYHLLCVGGDPAPLAPADSRIGCVLSPDQCPPGTHAENEPEICRDIGYPPNYHLFCVHGIKARLGSLDRWLPRGSSRQSSLRESMCAWPGDDCDAPYDCCSGRCSASTYTCG